ncbi:MAG: transposase [Phycisphaerales bacterium]|nr:MAG: transposase [Phycisphaerales bacterium]
MGDRQKQAFRVQFDDKLKFEFHGAKITSNAGLLAFRELDGAFRLTERRSTELSDCRQGKNTRHTMLAMLRQATFGRLAGYEDVNDAERLRLDPAMRRVVGGRAKEKGAASTSEMSRFETEMLNGNGQEWSSLRRQGQDCHDGAVKQADSRQNTRFPLGSRALVR